MTTTPDTAPTDLVRIEATTIGAGSELQRALVEKLAGTGNVRLEVGTLERVDTATLQLLAAFVRDLGAASRTVEWATRSEVLERAAQAVGLTAALALPAAAL